MLDVRKMLYSFKKLEVGLQNIERSIQNLQAVREYPAGVSSYSDMPKGSGTSSTTERFALKNIQEQEQTEKRLDMLLKDKEAYEETIQLIRSGLTTLSPEELEVVTLRYFQGYRMSKVALVMGLGPRWVSFHHANAIKSIEQCLNGGKLNLKLKWFEKKEALPVNG